MSDVTLMTVPESPIEQINKDQIVATVNRVKAIIPGSEDMTVGQITAIAQEAILYRIVPGRDVHYFVNRGQLQKVLDYKYLKNFGVFKEQLLSGDDTATVEDAYRPLTDQERAQHNLGDGHIAAVCTITTKRERAAFAAEVKQWIDMGFGPDQAVKMAKEIYGQLGTSAVGVVLKGDTPPKGWSHYQLAEKLAFKNAINRKYGQPTADEMAAFAHRMAQKAMPEHWQNVDPTLPQDVQAKQADYVAITGELVEQHNEMTPEEIRERREQNVIIMRGQDEGAIGEDYEVGDFDRFVDEVLDNIKFFETPGHIKATMEELELEYSPETEELVFDTLAKYANSAADAEQGQLL